VDVSHRPSTLRAKRPRSAQLRAAILSGDDVSFWRAAKQADCIRQSADVSKARAAGAAAGFNGAAVAATTKAAATSFVDDLVKAATVALESTTAGSAGTRSDGTKDASTSGGAAGAAGTPRSAGGGRKGKSSSKPAWALSSEEVSKMEVTEEEELLRFADDLDFDSFMAALDDPELQVRGGGEHRNKPRHTIPSNADAGLYIGRLSSEGKKRRSE
jgi:hypothetical protein